MLLTKGINMGVIEDIQKKKELEDFIKTLQESFINKISEKKKPFLYEINDDINDVLETISTKYKYFEKNKKDLLKRYKVYSEEIGEHDDYQEVFLGTYFNIFYVELLDNTYNPKERFIIGIQKKSFKSLYIVYVLPITQKELEEDVNKHNGQFNLDLFKFYQYKLEGIKTKNK